MTSGIMTRRRGVCAATAAARRLLERRARRGHDALPGSTGAGEGDGGDVGMLDEHRADITASCEDVDHARRECLHRKVREQERGERRHRRRLEHHRIAAHQRAEHLVDGDREWKVPGADGGDDAPWRPEAGAPPLCIPLVLLWHQLVGRVRACLCLAYRHLDLAHRKGLEWLALLLRQRSCEPPLVPLQQGSKADEAGGALRKGQRSPSAKGRLCARQACIGSGAQDTTATSYGTSGSMHTTLAAATALSTSAADAFGTRSNSWPLAGLMTAAVVPPCTRAPLMSIEGRDEDILLKTRVDAARKRIASTALS